MTYRAEFFATAAAQVPGLPDSAYQALITTLVAIVRDPWGASRADQLGGGQAYRWAPFGEGQGAVSFLISDDDQIVRIYDVIWTG